MGALCVFIEDPGLHFTGFKVDESGIEGNFIIRIKVIPEELGKSS